MRILRSLLCVAAAASVIHGCASPAASPLTDGAPVPGSAVESPIFSVDPCDKDEDCAPVAECHPARCTRRDRAGTMPSDLMCTMECRPGTVDCGYNHCGCAPSPSGIKVCALLSGPGR